MPHQFTFNGEVVVGAKRPLWNPIINRNRFEVGKPKFNSNKHVEIADRTYGTLVKRDPETAGSIIFNWTHSAEKKEEIDHGRDFITLNKMSVNAGASTPIQVSSYRSGTDARIISRPGDILRLKNQVPVNIDKTKTYGTPSPPQECSMSDLIRHSYEGDWINEQLQKEEMRTRYREKKEAIRRSYPQRVRAAHRSTEAVPEGQGRHGHPDGFMMKKFKNVPSRVQVPKRLAPLDATPLSSSY
eukprot:NODE_2943_length_1083_cov_84.117988_g2699_i0.p1 GENE.NODE_2943_length_1083_cov_84.117988_g2699_i0~~NODE_2943_length_1083_cov_84.117988_g2699_i0.p1  ORF type:complete len:242 (+),score=38.90 NODE_2943_length_1083_cov_84.117988_g2699_i0:62-787(+)